MSTRCRQPRHAHARHREGPRTCTAGPPMAGGWCTWASATTVRRLQDRAAGGDEIRLTTAPGLDDGPEFTPDGAYIYFNSARSGRCDSGGCDLTGPARSNHERRLQNNWFPHISPDGKWIAYIAFTADVAPDDHPFYKHVLLAIDAAGCGPARVIAYCMVVRERSTIPSWRRTAGDWRSGVTQQCREVMPSARASAHSSSIN